MVSEPTEPVDVDALPSAWREPGSLWTTPLAVLDVETTGLQARGADRIVEVAVVRGGPQGDPAVWSSLVHPGRSMGATHIHGITEAMVAEAPTFGDVLDPLERTLSGALFVAHNASFDLSFLRAESARAGRPLALPPAVDTMGVARRHFGLPSNALDALCRHFGIDRERAHRAGDDALATFRLAWRMFEAIDPAHLWSVETALVLSRRRTPDELRALRARLHDAQLRAQPILVEYLAADRPERPFTSRMITVQRVRSDRVVAWCHLRAAERTFRLDRLRIP